MKNKIVFKSQKDFVKWVTVSNMFAKSRIMPMVALKQFNSLKANQRTNIKKAFEEYDQKRRIKIPKGEIDSAWTISVMVDAHIIATEYNVDPLTVIMCLNSPCKINERIVIKLTIVALCNSRAIFYSTDKFCSISAQSTLNVFCALFQ